MGEAAYHFLRADLPEVPLAAVPIVEDRCRPFAIGEGRSEEHTSELQSLMRISYAVFCLKKKIKQQNSTINIKTHIQQKNYTLNKITHIHNTNSLKLKHTT